MANNNVTVIKWKAAGLCIRCGKQPLPGKTVCDGCREKGSAAKKGLYARRRAAKVCQQCGAESNGKSKCPACEKKNEECRHRRREARKVAGICTECKGSVEPGHIICKKCSDERSKVTTERYYRNKAAGVCRACGKETGGLAKCDACRQKNIGANVRWYRERKEKHLCTYCDAPAVTETLCEQHRIERQKYSIKRWTKLRKDILNAYGNECANCGETYEFLLQIDHIEGGGNQHRREIGWSNLYLWLQQRDYPKDKYQLLCAACNWTKRRIDKGNKDVTDKCSEEMVEDKCTEEVIVE